MIFIHNILCNKLFMRKGGLSILKKKKKKKRWILMILNSIK